MQATKAWLGCTSAVISLQMVARLLFSVEAAVRPQELIS
jgi:hypothetical protein